MFSLIGALYLYTDIVGLSLCERGEVYANLLEVQACYFLIEVLGQAVYVDGLIFAEELNLCQGLIGERVAHHE